MPSPDLHPPRFFVPGPVAVRTPVRDAMLRDPVPVRSEEMRELYGRLQDGLRYAFRTSDPVLLLTASGTGALEAAVRNAAGEHVLSVVNGAFGERFWEIAEACGRDADRLDLPWDRPALPGDVDRALRRERYDAVTVVHSETSTGVLNPVIDLASVVREYQDTLILVDGVSSAPGVELDLDAGGLDVFVAGSQKALGIPPGLSFLVAGPNAVRRSARSVDRGRYGDFQRLTRTALDGQPESTPAVPLLWALEEQLAHIRAETLEARWDRHRRLQRQIERWADGVRESGVDLSIMAPAGYRSPTVTCVRVPAGWSGPEIVRELRRLGFHVGEGFGTLREATFRIGHMGDVTEPMIVDLLEALEEVLCMDPRHERVYPVGGDA